MSTDAEKKNNIEHVESIAALPQVESHSRYKRNRQLDEAAEILEQIGTIDVSAEDDKRVLRMIDWHVCIPMCIVYLCQQMDKGAVSSAAVFNLQKETNLHGTQYSWLSSCLYLAELCWQPVSSFALIVFPVKYWVMFNFIAWSAVTMATAACKSFVPLLICRTFLGIFEATILPSFVFITQMWWTRREATARTTAYQIANSCASIVGPLMAYGIGHVSTKTVLPYQAIFLFIGGLSMACCPLVWYLLPNSPTTAKFLRKGDDRVIAIQRLKANNLGTKSSEWKWYQVWETFRDPKTYLWMAMYLFTATPSGGFGAFGGLITKGFGFDSFKTILMQIPIGAIQISGLLLSTWLINKYRVRWTVIACLCIPPIGGAIGLIKASRKEPGALLACYYVALSLGVIQPQLYTWANQNACGSTKRVVTTALMFACQCAGNVIGPQVYFARQAPYYFTGIYVDIGCWVVLFCLICVQGFYLKRLNVKQAERRRALGMPADIRDMSIMPPEEAAAYKVELLERMKADGMDESRLNANAFDDMTDFENPSFIYVI